MRFYNRWAGKPQGTPENTSKCIASVTNAGGFLTHQCTRKRGKGPKGLWCGVHARMIERGKVPYHPPDEDSNGLAYGEGEE